MRISAILLTAGLSSRMEGENKMLLPLADSTVVQKTYEQLLASEVSEVVVVTGRESDSVQLRIKNYDSDKTRLVYNPNYEKGLTTSIQVGLRAIKNADAVMICLGDMPIVRAEDYRLLMESFANQNEYSIQVPFYQGQKGNPVIFGEQHFEEILNHSEMNGCSGIVQKNSDRVYRIEVSSNRFIQDIDTPNDYQRLLQSFK
ncbi:MAG: nucleotidyltransferase family protein [Cytophagia bacterium]|nr:nucleotidyltransferase family protein [Cytophagia bacterium]